MDVVYLVCKSTSNNIELLYSLRSLKNISHWKVFIVWYKPNWLVNVEHIPFEDNKDKYENVRAKYKIITEINNLSDNFIYMNDDFYFLKKQEIEYYKMWKLSKQLEYLEKKVWVDNEYYQTIKGLSEKYKDWDSFETHTPIIYNKNKLKDILKTEVKGLRSTYCNKYWIKGKIINSKRYIDTDLIKDCKVYSIEKLDISNSQKLLSSENNLCNSKEFRIFMEWLFEEKSIYENNYSDKYEAPKNMIKVKLLRPVYPYKSWEIMMMEKNKVNYFRNQLEIL